ncbi:MAG: hypothetical protein QM762_01015 [Chryseolinea sp.]
MKILFALPFIALIIIIATINVRLFLGPPSSPPEDRLLKQLRSLKSDIENGADVKMQRLYPEGYVFLNTLYGLAWCNYLRFSKTDDTGYEEAHSEISSALERVQSPSAHSHFNKYLFPEYGAFYSGWSNYLLGQKLEIEPKEKRNPIEIASYEATCDSIAKAVSMKTFPLSYGGGAWPADVVVCMASLAKHDKLFEQKYQSIIREWITQVKERVDSTGLIPHKVMPGSGKSVESSRGSSQSLMLIFLKEIDKDFALEQYEIFKTHFVDTTLGLTGIREYMRGQIGFGDVDSGPVVLGYGAASTIVGSATLAMYGDVNAGRLSALIEAFALPIENDSHRYHLLGFLPIVDAFIVWGQSLNLENAPVSASFPVFHLCSALVLACLIAFVWILIKPSKPDSARALTIPW